MRSKSCLKSSIIWRNPDAFRNQEAGQFLTIPIAADFRADLSSKTG